MKLKLKLEDKQTGWDFFENWEFRYWDGDFDRFKDAPEELRLKMKMKGDTLSWDKLLDTFVFFAETVYGYRFSKEKLINWVETRNDDYEIVPAFYSEDE